MAKCKCCGKELDYYEEDCDLCWPCFEEIKNGKYLK